ncbi:fibronectin type III domain-containing protein [Candidatus Gracilibacteria bacterium]|nr:fibronectin type III domain-containing protein [Candidatus Gracilibacteria bacterium]MCF7856003.1 fibronectin type III domain-containing protein [Candidatus Gracilibacteria bacterium]MCF7896304.1 fibronectin type III domain-containing protein [Candidatus Gracilibacteria bacterium]
MKNKILSAAASFALVVAMLTPFALAADQTLPDVENLVAEALPDGTIKLTWDAVTGADSYTIYYGLQSISEDGSSYENDVLLGNVTTYTVENLTPDTTYYFSAAADDSKGTYLGSYNYSEEVSAKATTTVVAPEPPVFTPVTPPIAPSALDIFLEDDHPSSAEPATPAPTSLPQSGPATAALVLVSGLGSFVYRKFKK